MPGLTVSDALLASLNNHANESSLIVIYIKNELFVSACYGNIVPTVQGRLFCVLYALIGIPATCLTLKSIGDNITELFTKLIRQTLRNAF